MLLVCMLLYRQGLISTNVPVTKDGYSQCRHHVGMLECIDIVSV